MEETMEMEFGCCPICQFPFPIDQLNRHADAHFEEGGDDDGVARDDAELARQIAVAPPSPTPSPTPSHVNDFYADVPFQFFVGETSRPSASCGHACEVGVEASQIDEKIRHIISSQSKAYFHKVEGGLLSLLKNCLEREPGNSRSVLSGCVDHFQSIASEGVGWTCGWRNIQMLTSHLIMRRPEARDVLFGGCGFVPDIGSLQRWLEVAWEKGFDVLGCDDFNGKIYGSNRWIGTTECAALLRSFGLRARIVDFDSKQNEGSKHVHGPMDKFVTRTKANNSGKPNKSNDFSSRKSRSYQVLIDWVWTYFSGCKPNDPYQQRVAVSDKMPLYFQHNGHSRTIVGVQVKHQMDGMKQYNLLILDPSHATEALERSLRKNHGWQQMIKRGIYTLKKPQYQLCYVDPDIARETERERLKEVEQILLQDLCGMDRLETLSVQVK
ncbi:Zinc finger-containing ubiquitin peptidase 1-like protein [Drosera capensis]